jgi:hypothetical protein
MSWKRLGWWDTAAATEASATLDLQKEEGACDVGRVVVTPFASALVAAGIILPASAAHAANPALTINFPAGVACRFALNVSLTGGDSTMRHGTDEVLITGGTGSALTFTRDDQSEPSVSLPSNGAASIIALNPDGSVSGFQLTGHNVLILFPTVDPAGPSTTLLVGRTTVSVDSSGNYHVLSVSGQQTDIYAHF